MADGQLLERVDVRLTRGAVIVGQVLDDGGEPVVDAYVTALKLESMNGVRGLRSLRQVQTDDLGQFRLYGLPSGRYFVAAGVRASQIAAGSSGGGPPRQFTAGGDAMAPTFYPGTTRPSSALPITVEPGASPPPVVLQLQTVRLAQIAGTVATSGGQPGSDFVALLDPLNQHGLPISFNVVEVDARGHFVLTNVPPGEYRIDVLAKSTLENVPQTGTSASLGRPQGGADELASISVTVDGEDIDGLSVSTAPGFYLAGRLVIEGAPASAQILSSIDVSVVPTFTGMSSILLSARGRVSPDATFAVQGVAGTRLIRLGGLPPGWAIKAVRVGGTDVTDNGLEFNRNHIDAEITVSAQAPRVTGVITDPQGAATGSCIAAVFAEDHRLWAYPMTRFIASARADTNGKFSIGPLPPGDYRAVALSAASSEEWAEPGNLERLRARALAINLAERETKTITLACAFK